MFPVFVPLQSNPDYAALFAMWIWPVLAGFLSAVVGGYFVVVSVNRWQRPTLVISLRENRYDGQAPAHYVHLTVLNKDTFLRRWIGGGTAVNCKCALTVNGRSLLTKWADREPWRTQVVFDASGRPTAALRVPDQEHIDQAKLNVIRPGETKHADVAVRAKGDSNCYIHTPENFLEQDYPRGPERNRATTTEPGTSTSRS